MSDLLEASARYIDDNVYEGRRAINPTDASLSEVDDGIALIAGFSHIVAFDSGDGLVLFDTSLPRFAPAMRDSLRQWCAGRVHTVAYTHGHVDHVGGMQAFVDEAAEAGCPAPSIVGHENVAHRFDRYSLTEGYNARINARQFSPTRRVGGGSGIVDMEADGGPRFGPGHWHRPDATFRESMDLQVGGLTFELHHARGETDDHLWAWVPEKRAVCTGDFVTWVLPNAGNPQKAQRYPLEWARALRQVAAKQPELLLPAHGLPIAGRERINGVLDAVAELLESLVEQCLVLMNDGARLDALIHQVTVPAHLADRPYLRAIYDEPEFIVRNVWRLYGGWYDGNPASLKPAPEAALAAEIAELAGGARGLAERARAHAETGELRLACHLAEMAALAAPADAAVHAARAAVYGARRDAELSLMARGIYGEAARESGDKAE